MPDNLTPDQRAALDAWYAAMGVNEAVSEAPGDWFAAAEAARAPAPAPVSAPAARTPPQQPQRHVAEVAAAGPDTPLPDITGAADLDALRRLLETFDGCGLKRTAKHTCFARGNPAAKLMLIGEAPGRDEDLQGLPFVGRAGLLLDRMLHAIGLDETGVYITNVIYWRPPGNRTPSADEVQACAPFLARQIELVAPEMLVFLGGAAAKQMLNTTDGIMRLRGKWRTFASGGRDIKAIATLHPAYLLRNPSAKKLAWADLLKIEAALKEI